MSEEVVQEAAAEEAPSQELMEDVAEEAVESAEAPEAPPEPERPDFSRQFAALARKERAIRQKEQEIANFAKQREQYESGATRLADLQKLAKENPAKLLGELGINYDELTQQVINEGNPTEEQKLRRQNELLQERIHLQFTQGNVVIDGLSTMTDVDIVADNGLIHVLDGVLLPTSLRDRIDLIQIVSSYPRLSKFKELMDGSL